MNDFHFYGSSWVSYLIVLSVEMLQECCCVVTKILQVTMLQNILQASIETSQL